MTGYDTASLEGALRRLLADLGARPPLAVTRTGSGTQWPAPVAIDGEWLTSLVDLLRPPRGESPEVAVPRLRTLIRLLTTQPQHARAVGEHVAALLASRMHRILYAESGTLPNTGFWSALTQRVLGRLLPPAPSPEYLRDLVDEVFHRVDDHLWLEAIPLSDWRALFDVLGVDGPVFDTARQVCRRELREALRLVSLRLAALGSDAELLRYLPALARHESPFLAQVEEALRLLDHHPEQGVDAVVRHLEVLLDQCDEYLATIRRRSHEAGVSVGLVFLLARSEQALARLRQLRQMAFPLAALDDPATTAADRVVLFAQRLVRQENRRNSVRDLFRGNVQLLARRVTEQASKSGEHYVTRSRSEFVQMFRAAAGAGSIIAVMALIKLQLTALHLPLAWEALAFSLNYGLGFVLIHVLHLTVATKQPAMTAATLAAVIDGRDDREARLDALADLAADVSRTQWVSIAGNVIVTMLVAFAIALNAVLVFGWQPADPTKAAHLLHDLHPWRSLALLHAAIAGVFLFLSGLISGYYDNQALYHRVPQRLRRVRWLRRVLGPARLDRLATYVEFNLGALVGNFLFGCMLGCTPVIGVLFGLPLDIRHVAFGSANFAYGLVGLQFDATVATIVVSAAGVLLVGLVNLCVSFSLALRVALRSRGVRPEQTDGLWPRVLRRFLASPRDFFWPRPAAAPDAG
ncbi:MAG TPA: site-specific recombinase [Steroidobacteraceae bacterium]|nr:site-specific recombinase [Steroidobacteraceae bacterium]